MEYNQKRIGKNIKELREKLGISRSDLANQVSLSTSFLGLVERGERGIHIENLYRICTVLGVPISDIANDNTAAFEPVEAREQSDSDIYKQISNFMQEASRQDLLKAFCALKDAGLLEESAAKGKNPVVSLKQEDYDIKY